MVASPASVSFGLVQPGATVAGPLDLADAGGGAGAWDVAVETVGDRRRGDASSCPPTVTVPGGARPRRAVDERRRPRVI